jgi:hypothetical protein
MTQLEKIYKLNGGLSPGIAENFRRHELEHPHRKHGIHKYSLDDFGLTVEEIEKYTSGYRQFLSENYGGEQAKKI